MSEKEIQQKLALYYKYSKNSVFTNIQNGLIRFESDLIVVRPSGWAEEVEIKMSKSDFKADFKNKEKKHRMLVEGIPTWNMKTRKYDWTTTTDHYCKKFWFAVPEELVADIRELVPSYAGLYCVNKRGGLKIVKRAPTLKHCKKVDNEYLIGLYKKLYYRFWVYKLD